MVDVKGPDGQIYHIGQVGEDGKAEPKKIPAVGTVFAEVANGATPTPLSGKDPATLAQVQKPGADYSEPGSLVAPGLKQKPPGKG